MSSQPLEIPLCADVVVVAPTKARASLVVDNLRALRPDLRLHVATDVERMCGHYSGTVFVVDGRRSGTVFVVDGRRALIWQVQEYLLALERFHPVIGSEQLLRQLRRRAEGDVIQHVERDCTSGALVETVTDVRIKRPAPPVLPRRVWEVAGPCKEFDSYILPGDSQEDHQEALSFAQVWLEMLWDDADVGDKPIGVTIQHREATLRDYESMAAADLEED